MQKSYIPKASEGEFCNGINLCTVRKTKDGISKIGIKYLTGKIKEEILENIINSDTYKGKKIVRTYSSGHIFLNDDKKEVFLVTIEKNGKIQHQFTGGSPLEEENQNVIYKNKESYKFDIKKVRENARIRTKNRTGIKVIEEYNQKPLVDWVLMESEESEENGEIYYKLVCLMHFIVKKYEGILSFTGEENTIGAKYYKVDELENIENIAPNAYIVSKKAVELLGRLDKTIIITDFSKTLTSYENPTTWSVFAESGFLGVEYIKDRNKNYEKFYNYELIGDIEKTKYWWLKHLGLFVKYGLTKELINKITSTKYFIARQGLKTFIETIQNKGIQLLVVSSGVSDFIKSFLDQNGILNNGIGIYGNNLIFNSTGKVIGYDEKSIITTLNKGENNFDLELYGKIILLGDNLSDLSMYNGNCLKIGFCESDKVEGYDIYLGNNGNLKEVLNYI